ncbi:formate dehydrogenase subunit gamma [Telmatospirillum sp. J64-1]|uniref:formate dehydrogenase subunit gamma n=1 Tax=Telmatospirillum sp. J64-1 TaxID=2502183 RepID=UPI0021058D4C|nr:formate dehydrogenase subunit gamma [Telmatospirillum sp. J64-1]
MSNRSRFTWKAALFSALMALSAALVTMPAVHAAEGALDPNLPTNVQPQPATTDMWRDIRQGEPGYVSIPNDHAAVLIQSEGNSWRILRNAWVAPYGALALGGMILALAAFYLIRGKIRVSSGLAGRQILRFKTIERVGHWLTAGSFIALALTGLNILYGRYIIAPVIGLEAFSWLTVFGKWVHNVGGFAFMAGLALIFILWAKDNLWDRYDLNWILKGGGLLGLGHPPARKFNFGQKVMFWMVILVGALVSATGLNLLFPFMFVDLLGMQLLQLAHVVASLLMIVAICAHIYIGTIGMEGATSAMTTGYVDENWAREHHGVWVEEVTGVPNGKHHGHQPAE